MPVSNGLRALGTIAWIGCVLATARSADADSTPLKFTFRGAPGCAERAALEYEVELRREGIDVVQVAASGLAFDVEVHASEGGFVARVQTTSRDHPPTSREIPAPACDELLEAVALVMVITATEAPPAVLVGPAAPPPTSRVRPTRWELGGGSSAAALLGVTPGVAPAIQPFLQLNRSGRWFAPALRVGGRWGWRHDVAAAQGNASFRITALQGAACPITVPPTGTARLRPCLLASYGTLEATGSEVPAPRTERHPWATAGVGALFEWRVALPVAVEVDAGLERALVSSRFRLGDTTFHETSPLVGHLALGLSFRLPLQRETEPGR